MNNCMTKKRIFETLLCLVGLVAIVGYGYEQNMVVQTGQREVAVQEDAVLVKDAAESEQTSEENIAEAKKQDEKTVGEDSSLAKAKQSEKDSNSEKEKASKADDDSEKEKQSQDTGSEKEDTALGKELSKTKSVSANEQEASDDGVDWTKVNTYEDAITMYALCDVNVRKGPDTTYDVLGTLATNAEVETIGEYTEGKWMAVTYKGEKAFISASCLGEEQVDLAAMQAQQAAAATPAESQPQAQQPAQQAAAPASATASPAPTPPYIASPAGVVFVGDSRCVQMSAAVGGGGSTWICENGKQYSWFESYAVPRLDNIVGKGTKVVICMGVNDPEHCYQYAALTNQKAAEWAARGATTYFVSVNPVWDNPYVTQEEVETFNATMPGQLNGVRWIDTASIVKQGGFKLVDGLHYDTNASINIFNLICGSL